MVRFKEWECGVALGRYGNKRIALQLYAAEDGEIIATASVNVPDEPCPEGHTFIKSWSENEGMLLTLVKAGVVEDAHHSVRTGYCMASLVKVNLDSPEISGGK